MRTPALALLIGAAVLLQPGRVFAQPNGIPSVTIRIYDYAQLPQEPIESAQKFVTALYAHIDVHLVWAKTVRPNALRFHLRDRDRGDLLINILPPAMARRMELTDETLGVAAVTKFDGGTIAYVMFDRVSDLALTSNTSAADVLAVVMAHELGHLLLPFGSHSPSGVMRGRFSRDDFMPLNQQQLDFTSAQADAIRGMLTRRFGSGSLSVQTAGQ
jgi:hypothetical protein